MLLISKKTLTQKIAAGIIATIALASISTLSFAADDTRSSKSISFVNSADIDKAAKDELLKQAETDVMTPLIKQGFRKESALPTGFVTNSSGEISIYDASTDLISDFDYDGFYHRFSVSIDADTIHSSAYVFAKLYLSYEGGPWNHYATSTPYHIYGDSALDNFVIETELADGFSPGYYDVRIELYDADYGDWLLSYGPYDDASLSSLPLEDSYYDDTYIDNGYVDDVYFETDVEIKAGSMGWWLLIAAAFIAMTRLFSTRNASKFKIN